MARRISWLGGPGGKLRKCFECDNKTRYWQPEENKPLCTVCAEKYAPRPKENSMYVLQHTETGKYVACPGAVRSYTNRLEEARVFRTAEGAKQEMCRDSETIVDLRQLFERAMCDVR